MVRKVFIIIVKIALVPVALACTVAMWIGMFLNFVSSWVFYTLSIISFLTALGCWGFGLDSMDEVIRTMIISLVMFLIPVIAESVTATLCILKTLVWTWIFG